MYRFLFFCLLMLNLLASKAQMINQTIGSKNTAVKSLGNFSSDSTLGIPKRLISPGRYRDTGSICYRINDSTVLVWTGSQWKEVGSNDNSIATGSRTANGDYVQDWLNHWFFLNNLKALDMNSDRPDPNHSNNRKVFRFYSDSTVDGYPLQLMWGLKNTNGDSYDSIRFEITSEKNGSYINHHVDGGSKYTILGFTPG